MPAAARKRSLAWSAADRRTECEGDEGSSSFARMLFGFETCGERVAEFGLALVECLREEGVESRQEVAVAKDVAGHGLLAAI